MKFCATMLNILTMKSRFTFFRSKPARRLRRQKVERMADAKTKGLVRKCRLTPFFLLKHARPTLFCLTGLTVCKCLLQVTMTTPPHWAEKRCFSLVPFSSPCVLVSVFGVTWMFNLITVLMYFLQVRGTECCTWSPSPCVSLTTSSQDM